jgi:hypothetical protein
MTSFLSRRFHFANSCRRVAEVEQKLDSLYALLSAGTEAAKETTAPPMVTHSEVQPVFSFEATPSNYSPSSQTTHRKATQQFPVFSLPFLVFDDIQDVISKGVMSLERAEESIQFFRTKACSFPFVLIPPQMSLDRLRREKPFLLLSILTCAAQSNNKLQAILELELRESLGKKVIISGEKSMDLLQGVLVYLTWYIFKLVRSHFVPRLTHT